MRYPSSIQQLIAYFSKLPSVGPKTAERYVFYLLKKNPEELQGFAQSIAELREKTTICQSCQAYAESDPCPICADPGRDAGLLCIVADTRDMLTIESTNEFKGRYYVLNGLINAIEDIGPEDLNMNKFFAHIKAHPIKELVLAFNPNVEGETTAMYLAKALKPLHIRLTRLARGLPMGSDLEYADELTLANALKFRNEL